MATRHLSILALPLHVSLSLTACSYITQNEYESKLDSIDEDNDGSAHSEDCDDRNADIKPGAAEIPYNGIDEDCSKADLIDLDDDGFPGISAEAYEALGPKIPFPSSLADKPLDCDDNLSQVYPDPTKAIEVLYDAVDADCQKDNDFDADGDGFMPDVVTIEGIERPTDEVLELYIQQWEIPEASLTSWAPPGHTRPEPGDCDDIDASVHPENAEPEVYYDGIDRDCDHKNDFDMDGDCFMPPAAEPLYSLYVTHYYGTDTPPFCVDGERPFEDCLDEEDPSIRETGSGPVADPALVHPSTTDNPNADAPYDWIDADCARDNDLDADRDGFLPDTLLDPYGELQDYAAMWGYEDLIDGWAASNPDAGLSSPATGDCNDDRFDTWPGALEILGDTRDQDCQGNGDTSTFGFGNSDVHFTWTAPSNPEVTRLGDYYLVMVGAKTGEFPTLQQEFGIALPFSPSRARGGGPPDEIGYPNWKSQAPTLVIEPLIDIALMPNPPDTDGDTVPDPIIQGLTNSNHSDLDYTYLTLSGLKFESADIEIVSAGASTTSLVQSPYSASNLDVVYDSDGNPFSLACSDLRLNAIYGVTGGPFTPSQSSVTTATGDMCFFSDVPSLDGTDWSADFSLCTAGSCANWTLSDTASFSNNGPDAATIAYGDQDEGWIVTIDSAGSAYVRAAGGVDQGVFPGETVLHLDASEHEDTLYVAAIIDGASGIEVWLEFGPATGERERIQLPFDDPDVIGEIPATIGVFADADRVGVAVSALGGGSADTVGWVFFGP